MQGDPKVDELMRPVMAAIKRHVKDSDAKTDIYNRAYEAIMISMEVNKSRAEKAEEKVKSITERCEELESRLDLYHGNMMDVLQDALHKASEKIASLESSLSALREQTRWIPVGERLPEIEVYVLTRLDDGDIRMDMRYFNGEWGDDTVTHWRPIDLPHEGESGDTTHVIQELGE